MLHLAIFVATCVSTKLRDKLHETLLSATAPLVPHFASPHYALNCYSCGVSNLCELIPTRGSARARVGVVSRRDLSSVWRRTSEGIWWTLTRKTVTRYTSRWCSSTATCTTRAQGRVRGDILILRSMCGGRRGVRKEHANSWPTKRQFISYIARVW